MTGDTDRVIINTIRNSAYLLEAAEPDCKPLINMISDANVAIETRAPRPGSYL